MPGVIIYFMYVSGLRRFLNSQKALPGQSRKRFIAESIDNYMWLMKDCTGNISEKRAEASQPGEEWAEVHTGTGTCVRHNPTNASVNERNS